MSFPIQLPARVSVQVNGRVCVLGFQHLVDNVFYLSRLCSLQKLSVKFEDHDCHHRTSTSRAVAKITFNQIERDFAGFGSDLKFGYVHPLSAF